MNDIPANISEEMRKENNSETERLSASDMKRMLYLLSHDFREPIRMIHTFVKLTEKDYLLNIDASGKEYLFYIYEGVERLRRMLDGLLLFYRISAKELAITEISLNQVVEDIREDLILKYRDTKATINCKPLPLIRGDHELIKEMFFQVLENAILHNHASAISIHIECNRTETGLYVCIKDNGKGIDEKQVGRVFDILQSFDKECKRAGIGLSVVKKIIEKHGGAIEILSKKHSGTEIRFHFNNNSIISENG